MKKAALIILAVLAVSLGTSQKVVAEDSFDLATLSCFDVLSLPEDDSLFVTALLIGHLMGQTGTSESTAAGIQSAVEGFDVTCGESPGIPAIVAMESQL